MSRQTDNPVGTTHRNWFFAGTNQIRYLPATKNQLSWLKLKINPLPLGKYKN